MSPIEAPTGGMAVPGMNCGDSGSQGGIGGRFITDGEGSEDDEYGEGDYRMMTMTMTVSKTTVSQATTPHPSSDL